MTSALIAIAIRDATTPDQGRECLIKAAQELAAARVRAMQNPANRDLCHHGALATTCRQCAAGKQVTK